MSRFRLDAYAAKKSKKPALIAKTSVLLDCKPWDDETDMDEMLKNIKTIEMDGLVWGANKLVPIGYGIKKLQVNKSFAFFSFLFISILTTDFSFVARICTFIRIAVLNNDLT